MGLAHFIAQKNAKLCIRCFLTREYSVLLTNPSIERLG